MTYERIYREKYPGLNLLRFNQRVVFVIPPEVLPERVLGKQTIAEHRESVRVCTARLRAEKKGLDTSGFPPRVRVRKQNTKDV